MKARGCSASAPRVVSDPSPTGPEAKPSGPVLSLQDLLRPRPLPQVPARGLLPVPGLPDRAARGGGCAAAQRPSARARGGPAPDPGLRGRPRRLYRGVRHHPRGLHLRARARQGCRRRQLQPGQAGPALSTHPQSGDPEETRTEHPALDWTGLRVSLTSCIPQASSSAGAQGGERWREPTTSQPCVGGPRLGPPQVTRFARVH